jgi:hypothetical protein
MSNSKPLPLFPGPQRVVCPVCRTISYSSSGIHPQCAASEADRVRMDLVKLRKAEQAPAPVPPLKRYEKRCVKCQTVHHFRKQRCSCGYVFPAAQTRTSAHAQK